MAINRILQGSWDGDPIRVDIPLNWMQGRTAYGGLSAAFALAAAQRQLDEPWPLRSAQFTFLAPVAGSVELTAAPLRKGRNAAFVQAAMGCGGAPAFTATLLFARARPSDLRHCDLPCPEAMDPEDTAPRPHQPQPTRYSGHMDFRPARRERATSLPEVLRWVRVRERQGLAPAMELLLVGDALPPAGLALLPGPTPGSSLNWSINLLDLEAGTDDGWWLVGSRCDYAADGITSQSMTIWNRQRQPVAVATQRVALYV